MIDNIANKEELCTGCGLCAQICPKKSIKMEYDREGFLYPVISDNCIECGLCKKKCPVNQDLEKNEMFEAYIGSSLNKEAIYEKCSSGGIAYEMSRYVIENGGVACGARFSEDFTHVFHTMAKNETDLEFLKGSKYIQSETRNCYDEVKKCLKNNSEIIYIGTPCQIAGLKAYLEKEYEKLYTIDFMCHGVMSTRVFNAFIKNMGIDNGIKDINFRDKKDGYDLDYKMSIVDSNGKKHIQSWYSDYSIGKAFAGNLINRKSCSSCPYASKYRVSDITLADNIDDSNKREESIYGTSLITINTKKGKQLLKLISGGLDLRETNIDNVKELRHFVRPAVPHRYRKRFFKAFDGENLEGRARKYFNSRYKLPITIQNLPLIIKEEMYLILKYIKTKNKRI